ncbi:MAG: bifunctional riboflavin kinase/FAD synthetase [Desulfopila sp.]
MKIYRNLEDIRCTFPHACVTIGNFDGVHLGHQQLFARVARQASRQKGVSVAITFEPHPLQVLKPGGIKLISTCEQKIELVEIAGIDVMVIVPFTREFAATTAEYFVDEILLGRIGMRELVVGYDYAFGRGRAGNIPFLQEQGRQKDFSVEVVEACHIGGILVSSTHIRQLLAAGEMGEARRLLGRCYQIRGEVQLGKQRGGKEIGFPTANLKFADEDLVPRHGVYVSQVICDGKCYGGVINIGCNPTFGEQTLVAETHIFDFNQDIYGKPIKVNLLEFVRNERKFAGIDELADQIARDVACARRILSQSTKELTVSAADKFNS